MPEHCPICKSELTGISPGPDSQLYDCPKCGSYALTGTAVATVPGALGNDTTVRAAFSHALRKMQRADKRPLIDSVIAGRIIENARLPSPFEQADNLILWLGENTQVTGETMPIETSTHQAIVGAGSDEGMGYVLTHLFDTGLLVGQSTATSDALGSAMATLSFAGWERYEELKRGKAASRKAFMAMQYGDAALDAVVRDVFKPAVKRTGFDLVRLDQAASAGLIDDRLRVEILTSRFLLADLTHQNRGAYWEAGFAEGLGKPVIYTCRKAEFQAGASHFDTNHHLTVIWDHSQLDKAAEDLVATIRATLPDEALLTD